MKPSLTTHGDLESISQSSRFLFCHHYNNPLHTNADDFIIVISVNDSAYIASIISLNNAYTNIVFPSCKHGGDEEVAHDNITAIMTESPHPRFDKVTAFENVTEDMLMKDRENSVRTADNEWPIELSWSWLPTAGEWIFRKFYGNGYAQSCDFIDDDDPLLPTNNGFDILLAVILLEILSQLAVLRLIMYMISRFNRFIRFIRYTNYRSYN